MRLLIVEDQPDLREQLTDLMRNQGYAVDAAANGMDGEHIGKEYPVDLGIVDIGLPDVSGIELIRRWRQAGIGFPVLILTARGRWQDKVEGLEAGADDYLVKPFHGEELLARVRALVRRAAGWSDATIRCGPLALDPGSQTVRNLDHVLDLTAFEYKILEYLMLHAGEVVSKTELSEHIYDEEHDRDSNVLEVLIGRLRRKIDPDRNLNPIETLRGRGYVLRLPRET